jgi:glyoxylase-like metal-dependent hydrolase (beta-lactamase superfamily II)
MAGSTLELSDRLWRGDVTVEEVHPVLTISDLDEVAPGVAFVNSFGNVTAVAAGDALVLVDTGNALLAQTNFDKVRAWSTAPLDTVVYTHGHIDHVFGLGPYQDEADSSGRARPRVVAHELVPARFDRYRLTAGYNGIINARQFKMPGFRWPTE